jgi:hypothetical protein
MQTDIDPSIHWRRWFRDAMSAIRGIWPWTRFVIYTPAEIIIGLGGPFRMDGRTAVNDNERSTSR